MAANDDRLDWLWYFAYGSNLDPRTFLGRRRMRPDATRVARLDDYRLVFDLPIGPGERGVANLRSERGAQVWGVAYRISPGQARHLDRTEGVPRAYRRIRVSLEGADGEHIPAFSYLSPHRRDGRKPSRRYLGLLLRGARHHGLPAEAIRVLRSLELAKDERTRQGELFETRPGNR